MNNIELLFEFKNLCENNRTEKFLTLDECADVLLLFKDVKLTRDTLLYHLHDNSYLLVSDPTINKMMKYIPNNSSGLVIHLIPTDILKKDDIDSQISKILDMKSQNRRIVKSWTVIV